MDYSQKSTWNKAAGPALEMILEENEARQPCGSVDFGNIQFEMKMIFPIISIIFITIL